MDASVVAKWVLPVEPHRENAFKLRHDHVSGTVELCAPTILAAEVANALWKAIKFRRFPEQDAQEALKALNDLKITLLELDWMQIIQGLSIACKLDLAVYDASYLCLAEKLKAQFVTADNRLYEKAKDHFNVMHIKNY